VCQEILRPPFELKTKSLSKVCRFISFFDKKNKSEWIFKLGIASSSTVEERVDLVHPGIHWNGLENGKGNLWPGDHSIGI
jgi:hypothetical protein